MPLLRDDGNVRHIARHSILPEEAEQVLENDPFDISATCATAKSG